MGGVGGHGAERGSLGRGKEPRTVLAGPYGHPFHPIMVTVPIGAWVASVVFDIVALGNDSAARTFAEGAYWLIGIGIVGAVLAAVFGLVDLLGIPRKTVAFRTGLTHMILKLTVVVLFAINFGVRAGHGYESASVAGFVLSLIGLAILGVSGWLGGKLAYRYGVRVADERTQGQGFAH
ncbi:DUF2231 domain-containing protein [Kribbella hippodromi]